MANMVDKMPVAVMTCDIKNFIITYVNEATIEGLKQIEDVLPCKAEDIVGQCIDIFHKKPAHQRRMLSDPSNLPHQTIIEIGGQFLDLMVSPLYEGNKYVGPLLTWQIVTEKVRVERETAKLMKMLNDMPINVMMLDPQDFTINYVNQTSVNTLRPLQSLLPVSVDELQGSASTSSTRTRLTSARSCPILPTFRSTRRSNWVRKLSTYGSTRSWEMMANISARC